MSAFSKMSVKRYALLFGGMVIGAHASGNDGNVEVGAEETVDGHISMDTVSDTDPLTGVGAKPLDDVLSSTREPSQELSFQELVPEDGASPYRFSLGTVHDMNQDSRRGSSTFASDSVDDGSRGTNVDARSLDKSPISSLFSAVTVAAEPPLTDRATENISPPTPVSDRSSPPPSQGPRMATEESKNDTTGGLFGDMEYDEDMWGPRDDQKQRNPQVNNKDLEQDAEKNKVPMEIQRIQRRYSAVQQDRQINRPRSKSDPKLDDLIVGATDLDKAKEQLRRWQEELTASEQAKDDRQASWVRIAWWSIGVLCGGAVPSIMLQNTHQELMNQNVETALIIGLLTLAVMLIALAARPKDNRGSTLSIIFGTAAMGFFTSGIQLENVYASDKVFGETGAHTFSLISMIGIAVLASVLLGVLLAGRNRIDGKFNERVTSVIVTTVIASVFTAGAFTTFFMPNYLTAWGGQATPEHPVNYELWNYFTMGLIIGAVVFAIAALSFRVHNMDKNRGWAISFLIVGSLGAALATAGASIQFADAATHNLPVTHIGDVQINSTHVPCDIMLLVGLSAVGFCFLFYSLRRAYQACNQQGDWKVHQ